MRAWENFYAARIFRERDEEVKQLKKNALVMGFLIFVNWLNRSTSLIGVLVVKSYYDSDGFGFNQISAFLRIFDMIRIVLMALPFCIAFFVDLSVSIKRIEGFLLAENLD